MNNIAIFASGRGSNARTIIEHFKDHDTIRVALIVSNKPHAPVLDIAREHQIPYLVIDRAFFYQTENILEKFTIYHINFLVLAGFLWLIPEYLVRAFDKRMINIHPALLPKYGGKGMYGMHVHRAVKAAKESYSGITIHYVNEHYDEGQAIFQAQCAIAETDEAEDIAKKVQQLEHQHFAQVIEELLTKH
ncbi:MAG: phosphoribosylglycinamide formyltransferase [Bacteroidota bacterium]